MSDQPPGTTDDPFDLACIAAHRCVDQTTDLYAMLAENKITNQDFYFWVEASELHRKLAKGELTEADEGELLRGIAEDHPGGAGWEEPPASYHHTWVAGEFVGLWNALPEYHQHLEAVNAALNETRTDTIMGWSGFAYANAHEACLGMADCLCDVVWQLINPCPPRNRWGGRDCIKEWRWIARALERRQSEIQEKIAALEKPYLVGPGLLAAARLERDRGRKNRRPIVNRCWEQGQNPPNSQAATGPERRDAAPPAEGGASGKSPIGRDEANLLVRQHLKAHPNASVRAIHRATGVSVGAVAQSAAWQAHQAAKKIGPGTSGGRSPRERQLTRKILAVAGKEEDPSRLPQAEEAAWQYLLETATPDERARLHALTPAERAERIRLVIEQFADQDDENADG
jgi:hypothetical protein